MNAYRVMMQRILQNYQKSNGDSFTGKEGQLIAELIDKEYLNKFAFASFGHEYCYDQRNNIYPLKSKGQDYLNKSPWKRFTEKSFIEMFIGIAGIVGVLAGLVYAILQIISMLK